jgi:hypothetical protein
MSSVWVVERLVESCRRECNKLGSGEGWGGTQRNSTSIKEKKQESTGLCVILHFESTLNVPSLPNSCNKNIQATSGKHIIVLSNS